MLSLLLKMPGQKDNQWRFARPSHRNIPDGDNRDIQECNMFPSPIKQKIAKMDSAGIPPGSHGKQCPTDSRSRPLLLASNQFPELFFIE